MGTLLKHYVRTTSAGKTRCGGSYVIGLSIAGYGYCTFRYLIFLCTQLPASVPSAATMGTKLPYPTGMNKCASGRLLDRPGLVVLVPRGSSSSSILCKVPEITIYYAVYPCFLSLAISEAVTQMSCPHRSRTPALPPRSNLH